MSGIWAKLQNRLIDTHCHLLDYEKPNELLEILCQQKVTVHWVTTTLEEYRRSLNFHIKSPLIHRSPGLFPLYAEQEKPHLQEFLKTIETSKLIGEVGLDYTASIKEQQLQRKIFQSILDKCHNLGNKVLSIHSRKAGADVLKMIGCNFNGTAIMHWYSGKPEEVVNASKNTFFSINTAMLKSRNGKEIIKALRPQQVLTETDGPYVKINSKPSSPIDIRNVIQALSSRWDMPVEKVLETIESNYKRAMNQTAYDDV